MSLKETVDKFRKKNHAPKAKKLGDNVYLQLDVGRAVIAIDELNKRNGDY